MNPRIVLATAAVLAIVVSPGAAQTLTQPNSQTKTPPPAVATKSRPTGHVKTCDAYGAGFQEYSRHRCVYQNRRWRDGRRRSLNFVLNASRMRRERSTFRVSFIGYLPNSRWCCPNSERSV